MSDNVEDETTVTGSYSVTVPAVVRRKVGIEAGDTLRWHVNEDGALSVKLVKQQNSAFSELEPVDIGKATDATEDQDFIAGEY